MKKKITGIVVVWIITCLLLSVGSSSLRADQIFIKIGGGDLSGVYFPAGWTIAKMLDAKRDLYGIRATVEATTGATYNLNAILAGYMDFGLTQSDKLYQAVNGLAEWKDRGPQSELRAVFSLYRETLTLVAAEDAGISAIGDLKGKIVSTGNPGSSQHRIVMDALKASGLNPNRDIDQFRVMASEAPALLQDHRIDAFFFTVGHPNDTIKSALTGERKARIIPISGPGIDKLVDEKPYYTKAAIPVNQNYPGVGSQADVATFGVTAILCTSTKVSADVVYVLTKEVFNNLEMFRQQHPAFHNLTPQGMLDGLSVPIHQGALRYFKETGLILIK
jgi:uncharacterized protein